MNANMIDHAVETEAFVDRVRKTLVLAGYPSNLDYQFKNPSFVSK
jgi:hypothetical protein